LQVCEQITWAEVLQGTTAQLADDAPQSRLLPTLAGVDGCEGLRIILANFTTPVLSSPHAFNNNSNSNSSSK
jgi:hypothetical protein